MSLLLLALSLGCGGVEAIDLTKLTANPPRKKLVEVALGSYMIPVPTFLHNHHQIDTTNVLQLQFELSGLVTPKLEQAVQKNFERRKGELQDRVIRVCRNARMEELQAPFRTLKLRLLDVVQPLFEGKIDDLVLTDIQTQPL